ncbi:hypothetical protein K474DRAFT_747019 [Panus rudis PR-1116 ss-1]|nr:hypothetical protein K474DRAFT_747019 [Panus rudis PR-1116 ss-1]
MSSVDVSKTKKKDKLKQKDSASERKDVEMTPHGKNEGMSTAQKKKNEMTGLFDHSVDSGVFDYDYLKENAEHLELFIIRVPDAIKPKHLQNLKLDAPSGSVTARVGSIDRKHSSYDVWCLGEDENDYVGGDEIKNFSCLVPRKKKEDLRIAPKLPIRHLVVSTRPTLPTPEPSSDSSSDAPPPHTLMQNPPRPSYPKEVLKHRFLPYGSVSTADASQPESEKMQVDDDASYPQKDGKSKDVKEEEAAGGKVKKRKVDDSPITSKKSRKSKAP